MVKKRIVRDIAIQRIDKLLNLAYECARAGRIEDSRRYVEIALRVSRRCRVRIRRFWRRFICKRCHVMLVPGITGRFRVRSEGKGSRVVVTCLMCGWIKRYPIKLRGVKGGEEAKEVEGDSSARSS